MAHQGFGGVLDTPRSNAGDATYLSRLPDISDISPEASFIAPDKDDDLLQRLRNGRRSSIRTPRRKRPLADRPNLPSNIGGGEFTPLLKSATMNSTRRNGKENNAAAATTPIALRTIDEDEMTPLPRMDFSAYSTRNASYLDTPHIEDSSVSSTPIGPPPRRDGDMGPLQDGKQLSLREQENVIDKIEKENFGLKLKIQFLNDALMKAGPGYNEAALKENTELKVEKVTMQRELQRFKKQIITVERDLEKSRQRGLELEENAKKKHANSIDLQAEMDTLRQNLQDRESDVEELQRQASQGQDQDDKVESLQDEIEDLKAELREKEVIITDQEEKLETAQQTLQDYESEMDKLQHQVSQGGDGEEKFKELQDNNEELQAELQARESNINELEVKIEDLQADLQNRDSNMKELEGTIEDLQAELQNRDSNIDELESTVEDLDAKLIEKQGIIRKQQEDLDTLQQNLYDVESERDDLQLQVSQGQGHEDQVQSLQDDNKQLKAEIRDKQRIIREQESKLYDLEETKRKLNSALSQKEKAEQVLDEFEEQRANVSFIPKGLSRQREEKIFQLQAEFATLERKAAKLAMDNDNLQATIQEYAAIEQEAAKLVAEIDKLQAANNNLQATNNNLQATNDNLQATNDNLQAANDDLQATVQGLHQDHNGFGQGFRQNQNTFGQGFRQNQNTFGQGFRQNHNGFGQSFRQNQSGFGQGHQDFERQKLEAEVYSLEKMLAEEKKKSLECQKLEAEVHSLEKMLAEEKKKSGEAEEEIRAQYEDEIQRLDDEISNHQAEISNLKTEIRNLEAEILDLRAVIREKDNLYDNDSTEWETKKRMLESKREQAEEKAAGLQRTVDRLRQAEGSPSNKETKLQEAMQSEADRHRTEEGVLNRQIDNLQEALETRQGLLTQVRSELSTVRDELRQTKIDYQAQVNRVEELEILGTAENKASQTIKGLQQKLIEIEDEKSAMEELLEKAEEDAEEMAAQHELTMQRLVQKLDKAKRERDGATASRTETNKQSQQLRNSQAELESLEQDVLQQEKLIETFVASEAALRQKLERTRSERAAYRASAEKLQKDLQLLKKEAQDVQKQRRYRGSADEVLDTIVRAAENTEAQHRQKSGDMMLQMEFMHARWEREAALRKDVSYAKKFVQLQLDVAMACNKAQVRELQKARAYVLQSRHPVSIPELPSPSPSPTTFKAFLVMARFIARMRISARNWAPQEGVRKQLRLDIREKRRDKRLKLLNTVPLEALY